MVLAHHSIIFFIIIILTIFPKPNLNLYHIPFHSCCNCKFHYFLDFFLGFRINYMFNQCNILLPLAFSCLLYLIFLLSNLLFYYLGQLPTNVLLWLSAFCQLTSIIYLVLVLVLYHIGMLENLISYESYLAFCYVSIFLAFFL